MSNERDIDVCLLAIDQSLAADVSNAADGVAAIVDSFLRLGDAQKDEVRALLTPPEARTIVSLGVDAAARGVDRQSVRWVLYSLLIHDVEGFRDDPRNNMRFLATSYYAAEQIGADPVDVFRIAAQKISQRSASYLLRFVANPPEFRTLATFNVTVSRTLGGVRFSYS